MDTTASSDGGHLLTWVRMDDGFADHPKILALTDAAFRLHTCAMCWSGRRSTDGFIATRDLRVLVAMVQTEVKAEVLLSELIEGQLWEVADGGWMIHDFLKYNPRSEVVAERKEAHAEKMRNRRASGKSGAKDNTEPRDGSRDTAHDEHVKDHVRSTLSSRERPRPDPSPGISSSLLGQQNEVPEDSRTTPARVAESVPFNALACWAALAVRAGSKLRLAKDSGHETGLAEPHLSNFVRSAIGLSKRDPPFVFAAYEALGDWIAAGGLDWHAQHNTPPWKRVCERLEDCLSAAAEWDQTGRQPIGKRAADHAPAEPINPIHRPIQRRPRPEEREEIDHGRDSESAA